MSTTGTTAPVATTTGTPATLHHPTRLAVTGWVLYDLANTIFSMAIVSLDFSLWVRDQVGVASFDRVYGITMASSMAIIFALSLFLC
jgi:MFS transporter, UMF1 family